MAVSSLSLNFKGEECEVCTSVYQPLLPSIFRMGLTSALQYDEKRWIQFTTLFTKSVHYSHVACSMSLLLSVICVKVKNGHTRVLGQ